MRSKDSPPYIGQKYGKLTIIKFESFGAKPKCYCRCECGVDKIINFSHMKCGRIKSCGCVRKTRVNIGDIFEHWRILKIIPEIYDKNKKRKLISAECKCNCGTIKIIALNILLKKPPKCHCFPKKIGLHHHPYYRKWTAINDRCYNTKSSFYLNFGGKGILNYWKNDSAAFIKYLEQNLDKKSKDEFLTRIDFDKDFEPGNLQWKSYSKFMSDCFLSGNRKEHQGYNKNWFHSIRQNIDIYYHSSYELKYLKFCEKTQDIFTSCNFYIKYKDQAGNIKRYIPDFIINKKIIIEIKPRSMLTFGNNQLKFEAASLYCKENNLEFRVITEDDLDLM